MSIVTQGTFVSTGANVNLNIRSDVDYMYVYNYTQSLNANQTGNTVAGYWQRGMAAGTGIKYNKTAMSNVLEVNTFTGDGFTLFDNSLFTVGNPVATGGISNVVQPVVLTATTTGLAVGTMVLLSGITGVPNVCGIPFEIGAVNAGVSFTTRWPLANAPGAGGAGTVYDGFYRVIPILKCSNLNDAGFAIFSL